MPNVADKLLRSILGKSLITATTLEVLMGRKILKVLMGIGRRRIFGNAWIPPVTEILQTGTEKIGENLAYTDLMTWVTGYAWMFDRLPKSLKDQFVEGEPPPIGFGRIGQPPPPPDTFTDLYDAPARLRFPRIEKAAEQLLKRNAMPRDEFDAATQAARQRGFTVAGDLTVGTIQDIQRVLAEDIQEGTSLKTFERRIKETFGTSPLGPAHLETVYRTNVQAAFRDGRELLLENPIVDEIFPYQLYTHIADDRVREEHEALSTLGIDGTGIYRRDDPMWEFFLPPWDYNCRCTVIPLTIEIAASRGVGEAQEWLDTGQPPTVPDMRLDDIPFRPENDFVAVPFTGGGVLI